jgi:hypothetical protein
MSNTRNERMMMREKAWHLRAFSVAVVAVVATIAGAALAAQAAGIAWDTPGLAERCLEDEAQSWVNAKAAQVVNEDPSAGDVDDIDVALWAVVALQGCEQRAGHVNQASERRFSRHMAHWREHIFNVAEAVRSRTGAD